MSARRFALLGLLLVSGGFLAVHAQNQVASNNPLSAASTVSTGATTAAKAGKAAILDEDALRIEGEKRFHTNCGRCHQAPHKFPPRMMATIVRHMRVRATITDEDMRLILHFMTQ